jgi:hypothetical protein
LEEEALAPASAPMAAQTAPPTQYREFTNTVLRNKTIGVFKRTHACTSAAKDVWFQQRVLGLSDVTLMLDGEDGYSGTDDTVDFPGSDCMLRAAASAVANFSVHDVQTEKFATGPYTPHDWWKYLAKVHGQLSPDGFNGWNDFMSFSFGWFVPDLTDRIERWKEDQIAHLAYWYVGSTERWRGVGWVRSPPQRPTRILLETCELPRAPRLTRVLLLVHDDGSSGHLRMLRRRQKVPPPDRQLDDVRRDGLQRVHGRGERVPRTARRVGLRARLLRAAERGLPRGLHA